MYALEDQFYHLISHAPKPESTLGQKVYAPFEVALHNQPRDIWVSFLGGVYDISPLVREFADQPCVRPLLAYAGKDISHWFDEATQDIRHYVHPVTGVRVPYLPHGPIPHVLENAPSTAWRPLKEVPWWQDAKYKIGILSSAQTNVRIINTLTRQECLFRVCLEELVSDTEEKYKKFNKDSSSYCWMYERRELIMHKTLQQNGIEATPHQFGDGCRSRSEAAHAILLHYKDDMKYDSDDDAAAAAADAAAAAEAAAAEAAAAEAAAAAAAAATPRSSSAESEFEEKMAKCKAMGEDEMEELLGLQSDIMMLLKVEQDLNYMVGEMSDYLEHGPGATSTLPSYELDYESLEGGEGGMYPRMRLDRIDEEELSYDEYSDLQNLTQLDEEDEDAFRKELDEGEDTFRKDLDKGEDAFRKDLDEGEDISGNEPDENEAQTQPLTESEDDDQSVQVNVSVGRDSDEKTEELNLEATGEVENPEEMLAG